MGRMSKPPRAALGVVVPPGAKVPCVLVSCICTRGASGTRASECLTACAATSLYTSTACSRLACRVFRKWDAWQRLLPADAGLACVIVPLLAVRHNYTGQSTCQVGACVQTGCLACCNMPWSVTCAGGHSSWLCANSFGAEYRPAADSCGLFTMSGR